MHAELEALKSGELDSLFKVDDDEPQATFISHVVDPPRTVPALAVVAKELGMSENH